MRALRILCLVGLAALAACAPRIRDYGYAPSDSELAEIVVGRDDRDRVAELVGNPASQGLVDEDAWYYVAARQETVAFRAPVTTDRQLVVISFTDLGTVRNIERFTLRDGRVVTLSRRVTQDPSKGVGFLRQALSNIGRIQTNDVVRDN